MSSRWVDWCAFAVLLLPVGCAVYTPYPLGIRGQHQVALAVEPSSISAPVHNLSDIENVKVQGKDDNSLLQRKLVDVRKGIDTYVDRWAGEHQHMHLIAGAPVGTPKAALIWAKKAGADLLLAVDISAYGKVKRVWVALLFGSGVAEGITQGLVVASATGNPVLGAGVGAEEVASEGLTWVAGSWFWGKYFAPVTLDGRMWRVRDGKLIWHDVRFADNSDDAWKLLLGKPLPGKAKALATSLGEAKKDLFDDLEHYVRKQILSPGKTLAAH
jgi:hypothetical protein